MAGERLDRVSGARPAWMKRGSPVPKRLKAARRDVGISQRRLGIAAGMDEFTASPRINQYERGRHTPGYQTMERIANALDYPTAYFYTREDDLAKALLQLYRMSPRKRRKLIALLGTQKK